MSDLPPGLQELLEEGLDEGQEAPRPEDLEALRGVAEALRAAPARQPPPSLRREILASLDAEITRTRPWSESLRAGLRWVLVGSLGALLFAGYLGWSGDGAPLAPPPPRAGAPAPVVLASLSGRSSEPPARGAPGVGEPLGAGRRLVLPPGAEWELDWRGRGALRIHGPAELVIGGDHLDLTRGRIVSEVDPPQGEQFRVRTPELEVRVVGTRFRVSVEPGQPDQVAVEEGEVRVEVVASGEVRHLTPEQDPHYPSDETPSPAISPPEPAPSPRPETPSPAISPPEPAPSPRPEPSPAPVEAPGAGEIRDPGEASSDPGSGGDPNPGNRGDPDEALDEIPEEPEQPAATVVDGF